MNPISLRGLLACLALPALLVELPALRAQDAAPPPAKRATPPSELVISNGTFEWNGQRGPATLRRVVDAITSRYPQANITLVGTDDVLIESVTLRLRRVQLDGSGIISPPLHGMLVALRAASQNRFQVDAFGENDFVLSGSPVRASKLAEVFKFGHLIGPRSPDPGLQREIENLKTEIAVQSQRYRGEHPTIKELTMRREALQQQLERSMQPRPGADKLLAQLQEVVRSTLERLRPGEAAPEFKYHEGSGLLVVIGSEEAINVTRKVVDALN